jgi:hypothetical protein
MARQPATLPSHAIFPKRRAVPPVSWPLQRHDWQALIFTVCITAIFWQWRHLILLIVIAVLQAVEMPPQAGVCRHKDLQASTQAICSGAALG